MKQLLLTAIVWNTGNEALNNSLPTTILVLNFTHNGGLRELIKMRFGYSPKEWFPRFGNTNIVAYIREKSNLQHITCEVIVDEPGDVIY